MFKIHSIFPLFHFLLAPLFGLFAAGGDALAALGGDSAVVLDAPTDGGGDPGDESDSSGDGEGDGEVAAAEGEPEPGAKPAAQTEPAPELAKPLSGAARTALKALKAENPAAWKELNARMWALDGQDKKIAEHFPEKGIEQAIALKTELDTFLTEADAENLADVRGELNDFRLTDAQIIKGDPAFVKNLPENVQAGLYKMLPHFVNEWSSRDNDGYQRYFAGLVDATLRDTKFAQNMEMALWKLEEMGTDDPSVKKIHDLLSGNMKWMNDLKAKSTAAPVAKETPEADAKLTAREQTVKQRERSMSMSRVARTTRGFADPKMLSILGNLYGGKIPANVNKAEVMLRSVRNLAVIMGKPVNDKIGQYLDAGDEDGAAKYMTSQMTDHRLTKAVEDAKNYLYGKSVLGGTPAAAAAAAPGARPAAKPSQFMSINYDPKSSSIDWTKTDALAKELNLSRRQLISQNKCVLRNGKKVTWPRGAELEQ